MSDTENGVVLEYIQCWICLQDEINIPLKTVNRRWVRPCRCKGTAEWVHHSCLQKWIDEKQFNNLNTKVSCSSCKSEYILVFPPYGEFVFILEQIDNLLQEASPLACGAILATVIYWSALSYGALTVLQVCGQEEGKAVMEEASPLSLLIILPSIPLVLIFGKMISWENSLLTLWRKYHQNIPFIHLFIGSKTTNDNVDDNNHWSSFARQSSTVAVNSNSLSLTEPIVVARIVAGALFLPTMADFVGRFLFSKVKSNFQRTLFGGMTFIICKGLLKIYLRQKQITRQSQRRILNFVNDDLCNQIDIPNNDSSSSTSSSSSNSPTESHIDITDP